MSLMKRTKLLMVQMTRTVTSVRVLSDGCPWTDVDRARVGVLSCEVHLSDILE